MFCHFYKGDKEVDTRGRPVDRALLCGAPEGSYLGTTWVVFSLPCPVPRIINAGDNSSAHKGVISPFLRTFVSSTLSSSSSSSSPSSFCAHRCLNDARASYIREKGDRASVEKQLSHVGSPILLASIPSSICLYIRRFNNELSSRRWKVHVGVFSFCSRGCYKFVKSLRTRTPLLTAPNLPPFCYYFDIVHHREGSSFFSFLH